MRAGVNIKSGQIMYTIQCSRCKAKLAFPANIDRKDAVMKSKTNHGWRNEGKKLYCDGCVELIGIADKQSKKPKKKPKEKAVKNDETIELGD